MLWMGSKHLRRFMSSVKDLPVEDVEETLTAADITLLAESIKALSTEDGLHETTEKYEAQKTRADQMWNVMKNGKQFRDASRKSKSGRERASKSVAD